MNRRDAAFGLFAIGASLRAGWAQQPPPRPVIGFLSSRSAAETAHQVAAYREGLAEAGYVEGKNVTIEYRWAEGSYGRLTNLAADLVGRRVAVIATTGGTPSALAAKAATTTIPIVFNTGGDLAKLGLASSLGRPIGNVTGISQFTTLLGPKRLELLREISPSAAVIGVLGNATNPNFRNEEAQMQSASNTLGIKLSVVGVSNDRELKSALKELAKRRVHGLVVTADGFLDDRRKRIAAFAMREGIPAIYPWLEYVLDGGLMSYGIDAGDSYRQAGIYTGRILRGAKPEELPVMQPTKFQLAINLKTSKALGLTIPPSVLVRADRVIE
jgi:putative ABC transport system substrate-binding protein